MPKGFSLVETMITVALLLALVGGGGILSARYLRGRYVRASAETLLSELRAAQGEARAQLGDAAHGVKAFPDRVVRFTGDSYAARASASDVTTALPAAIAIEGADEAVFPKGGVAPASPATFTFSDPHLTVDVAVSAYGLITLTPRPISD
ncbi:prepilin-type N-terminal cleavage/methylation domain-containing protein [Patescibacteria group bacterium]|nr:MAG: prepilin-type N-terminal cleavage/methylation domain-containing protein [Patescibacteria group bacterium]